MGVPKMRGYLFGGPDNTDPTIQGIILVPYFRKLPYVVILTAFGVHSLDGMGFRKLQYVVVLTAFGVHSLDGMGMPQPL